MLTDTARGPTDARNFLLWGLGWSLGLFGLLKLPWTEAHVLLPFTRAQGVVAARLFGTPSLPIEITLACSGADALALSLAVVVAYPVSWRARLTGAAGGAALIVGLNTLRIGVLGRAASSAWWFDTLHVYVWPLVLVVAIAAYVFTWMQLADRRAPIDDSIPLRPRPVVDTPRPSRLFVLLALALLVLFSLASSIYLQSPVVLALAAMVARAAAAVLGVFGVAVSASANVLWTPRGGFAVTQECIFTPLIPIYLAAVCAYAATWKRWLLGVGATGPLFITLGVARLLVVALPDVFGSPLFLVHAFFQLLLGAVLVFAAALWRHGLASALRRAPVALLAGTLFALLIGPFYTQAIAAAAVIPQDDPQGAIVLLPGFQVSFYLALWIAAFADLGWRRVLSGLAALGLTQIGGLLALHALVTHFGLTAQVRDIRGWAIAGPLLIVAAVTNLARAPR